MKDQHTGKAIKHHCHPLKEEIWQDPKITVVPGLAPTIPNLMARAKLGLPTSTATRTLETMYRGMDITDTHEMGKAYVELKAKLQTKQLQLIDMKRKAREQEKNDFAAFKKFMSEQQQQQQNQQLAQNS